MKKIVLLAATILSLSSVPASAGGINFGFFAPAPVYVDYPPPRPQYVVYPSSYRYYRSAPVTEVVYYDRWNRPVYVQQQCRKHKRHDHDDDDDDRVYGRVWRDSDNYYRKW